MCRAVYSKLYEFSFVCRLTISTAVAVTVRLQYVFITLQFMLPLVQNRFQFFREGGGGGEGAPCAETLLSRFALYMYRKIRPGEGGDGAYCSNCMIALVGKCFYVTDSHSIIN